MNLQPDISKEYIIRHNNGEIELITVPVWANLAMPDDAEIIGEIFFQPEDGGQFNGDVSLYRQE